MDLLCKVGTDELSAKRTEYFDSAELYLESPDVLDEYQRVLRDCRNADISIKAVHTPHIRFNQPVQPVLKKTDELAAALNAVLVLDSNPVGTRYIRKYTPQSDTYGIENDPSVSPYYLKKSHLYNDQPLVLDTAHLHMSVEDTLGAFDELIANHTVEEIPVVHLADGSSRADGLEYGAGDLNLDAILISLRNHEYEGLVVLEFPTHNQIEALESVHETLAENP